MGACATDVILEEGAARLLRLRLDGVTARRAPVLLVPSLINRWYVLDLDPSLAAALVGAGLDVHCLDWGVAGDEDRYLGWDDIVMRLFRAVRRVRRGSGTDRIALVGYCLGGTLAAIAAALDPSIAALVDIAGPIDFAAGGMLAHLTRRRWFDADAIAAAGNVAPWMMQSGFVALRPTLALSKIVRRVDLEGDARARAEALEAWADDNVPFPAAAYARYVRELYQENALVRGEHRVAGRAVDLGAIRCPVLTVVADRDTICPPAAARALNERCSSRDVQTLTIHGSHVGAVVGARAAHDLHPALARWLLDRLSPSPHPPISPSAPSEKTP